MEVRVLVKAFALLAARVLSIPDKKRVHFIPDRSCAEEHYNLERFSSDNVLSVVKKITNDELFDDIDLSMVSWDKSDSVRSRAKIIYFPNKYITNTLRLFLIWFGYYRAIYRSAVVVTSSPLESIRLLYPGQIHIAANYYIPFKSDAKWTVEESSISSVVTTGVQAAVIDSKISAVPPSRYISLGFPRNDYLTRPRLSKETVHQRLGLDPDQRILLYNPTHRSQLESSVDYMDHVNDFLKSNQLLEVLNTHNAVLVVKLHSNDISMSGIETLGSHVKFYRPGVISYYDILPHAELMITDYSSIYFDFLLTNKPVIFYQFDYDSYKTNRGFAHSDLSEICAGPRCYSRAELIIEISSVLGDDADKWCKKRLEITNKFHCHTDGKSAERFAEYILGSVKG